jgi:uncharacterized sporulation protein YeaH/YhbH (DUF444 family)
MVRRIEEDKSRFDRIVRGKIKRELRKYITHGEMIGRRGKDFVSIPLPQIEIPRFRYGRNKEGGVGQGEGDVGDPIGAAPGEDGAGQAGDAPGRHIMEVDVPLAELAKLLGEELELPKIKPRGKKNVAATRERYVGIRQTGPESLRHFKRSFREALKREMTTGTYDPDNPIVVPLQPDRRYRSWREVRLPENNAVIIYVMDVSGSMGDEQKEIVRIESFWIDTWLRSQYKHIESRYIIHDAVAYEVDQKTFYSTRESGGTKISSAYKLCNEIIDRHYPVTDWNIYPFHFSDGDNWGGGDTKECIRILREELIEKVNQFAYGQVESPYGSGQFIKDLEKEFKNQEELVTSQIKDREAIYDSIKDFLGKGR